MCISVLNLTNYNALYFLISLTRDNPKFIIYSHNYNLLELINFVYLNNLMIAIIKEKMKYLFISLQTSKRFRGKIIANENLNTSIPITFNNPLKACFSNKNSILQWHNPNATNTNCESIFLHE